MLQVEIKDLRGDMKEELATLHGEITKLSHMEKLKI